MNPIKIMINGLPGNVATTIAKHALSDSRFSVIPASFTGPDITEKEIEIEGRRFLLVTPDEKITALDRIRRVDEFFISIDYTHPDAAYENVCFYCDHGLPFVMGTTGGDRDAMRKAVESSEINAVIAPNMAKQIVGLQAMMEYAAETFPGLFSGYLLNAVESHQSWKADTSGTAKAMISYFERLGVPCSESDIQKERDPEVQKRDWNIPDAYLDGHGWHTYTLDAPDETSRFSITHNINGRDIYAEGTLDAVFYLKEHSGEHPVGRVFSMIDVLKKNS